MNLSFHIARKYFFSKNIPNVIHLISGISILGITVGSFALIVVLSVFNGFENLVLSLYNTFDPDIKIVAAEGKYFHPDSANIETIAGLDYVLNYSETIEENVIVRYGDLQSIATFRALEPSYAGASGINKMVHRGYGHLKHGDVSYALVGAGIANQLGIYIYDDFTNLQVFVPRRGITTLISPERAMNRKNILPGGIFYIQQEFDSKFIIVPLDFARELVGDSAKVTSISVNLKNYANLKQARNEIQSITGTQFQVLDRYRQHALLYRILKSEKLAVYMILTFILLIAATNLTGALLMLVLDKKKDMAVLNAMGASNSTIKKIFLYKGLLLSIGGSIIGMLLGAFVCWLQIEFGIVKLQGEGTFVIDAYPVSFNPLDFVAIFITVVILGVLSSFYPSSVASKQINPNDLH